MAGSNASRPAILQALAGILQALAAPFRRAPRGRRAGPAPLLALVVGIVGVLGVAGIAGAARAGVGPFADEVGATDAAPANDEFAAAAAVPALRLVGTTVEATASPDEVAAGAGAAGQHVVWHSWAASGHGWAYLSATDPAVPAGSVPEVAVFTGETLASLTRVDDPAGGSGLTSIPVAAGTTYKVAVIGGAGDYDLTIFQPDGGVRPNDEPEGAIEVGAAVYASVAGGGSAPVALDTLGGATAAVAEPAAGGTPAEHSVWFGWTVPLGSGGPGGPGGAVTFTVAPMTAGQGPFRVSSWTGSSIATLAPLSAGGTSVTVTGNEGDHVLVAVDGPEQFFDLSLAQAGVLPADTTPPVVACTAPPTAWQVDAVAIACTATDAGVGLVDAADAAFDLLAELPEDQESAEVTTATRTVCDRAGNCAAAGPVGPVRIDRLGPEVTCDPPLPGWLRANPSVSCRATDTGSGLADPADADRARSTDVAAGEARTATIPAASVCDAAGNCTPVDELGPYQVDLAPPTVTCDPVPPGVQAAEVVVTCTAADVGSGLADHAVEAGFELRTDVGAGRAETDATTGSRDVCDAAGNCTTAGPLGPIEVDLAPPAVTCDVPDGWSTGTVNIACEATDVGTGLAEGGDASFALTASLAAGSSNAAVPSDSRSVCDRAGHCTPAGPFPVRIDNRAPVVACGAAPAEWSTTSPVEIVCGATDDGGAEGTPGSGLVSGDLASFSLTASRPAGQEGTASTDSRSVCDRVGNCATAGPVDGVRIDLRPPEVSCAPVPGGVVRIEAVVACTATDAGSGLRTGADASFSLATAVGQGQADGAAQTGEREVCDLAGNCVDAGPFTANVDRTSPPPVGAGPTIDVPGRVTVLAALAKPTSAPAPYDPPAAPGAVEVACVPPPGSVLGEGWTAIVCDAVGADGGHTTAGFPLVVKPLPSLAPTGHAVRGAPWRAVGVGFGPGSPVTVEVDGVEAGSGAAGPDGRIALTFLLASSLNPGSHSIVLRGTDATGDADPLLVVSEAVVDAVPNGSEPPTEVPAGAPVLPEAGPAVPGDPGPPPALPTAQVAAVPTTTTTTPTNPSTTTTSVPGETTTTTAGATTTSTAVGAVTTTTSAGTGADPVDASGEDAAGTTGSTPSSGVLPATGAAIGVLLVLAALLLLGGGSLRAGARRLARRD